MNVQGVEDEHGGFQTDVPNYVLVFVFIFGFFKLVLEITFTFKFTCISFGRFPYQEHFIEVHPDTGSLGNTIKMPAVQFKTSVET